MKTLKIIILLILLAGNIAYAKSPPAEDCKITGTAASGFVLPGSLEATSLNGITGNATTGYTVPIKITVPQLVVSPTDGVASGWSFPLANDIPPLAKGDLVFNWNRNTNTAGAARDLYKRSLSTITTLGGAATATIPTGYNIWFGDTIWTLGTTFDYAAAGFSSYDDGVLGLTIAMDGTQKVLKIVAGTATTLYFTASFTDHTTKQFRVGAWIRSDETGANQPALQLVAGDPSTITYTDLIYVGKTASDTTYYSTRRKSDTAGTNTANTDDSTVTMDTNWHFFEIVVLTSTTFATYVDGVKANPVSTNIDPFDVTGATTTGWSTNPFVSFGLPPGTHYIKSIMVTQEGTF